MMDSAVETRSCVWWRPPRDMSTPTRLLIDALTPGSAATALRQCPEPLRTATLKLAAQERLSAALGWRVIDLGWVEAPRLGLAEVIHHRAADPWMRLAAAFVVNQARNDDLIDQLGTVAGALDQAQVEWFPLKGAAILEARAWPEPGARAMTDLDLWVPDQARLATEVLYDLGYRPVPGDYRAHHHLAPMVLAGHAGSVEIHQRLVPDRYAHLLASGPMRARAQPHPGLGHVDHRRRLQPADLIRHLVVHNRLTDRTWRLSGLGLRSVLDVGYLWGPDPVEPLLASCDPRILRLAMAAHLAAVHMIFATGPAPSGRAARWWGRTCWLADDERRSWWWQQAANSPWVARRTIAEGWHRYRSQGWDGFSQYVEQFRVRTHQRVHDRPRATGA